MSESKVRIKINANASAMVEAEKIEIEMPDGSIEEKSGKVFICRCGESKNKPFCDGTHKSCGFEG